ncbi:MAG: glycoside hydrolase family 5 protein [Anaerolineae bacterium]|nr:glycoside hydrolase family 5 protein [Anaerolineae bacterium]MDW8068237.1 glycoside hydrolase family 5 protein [Anaerolineae bacterium]
MLRNKTWLMLSLLLALLVSCASPRPLALSPTPKTGLPAYPPYRATVQGVFRGDELIPLYGINWFGLETPDRAPHGLWTGRTVADFLTQMRDLGFTAIRLPLSPHVLPPTRPTPSWARKVGYPAGAHDGLRYFLEEAQKANLYVLLDFHTYDPYRIGARLPGRPFGDDYKKENWLADLRRLAELSLEFPNVFGIDLCNEPHALTWQEWKALAREGAEAILSVNPSILVIVEGVGNASDTGGWPAFWGENMADRDVEIAPELAERVLYLPHAYGPSVYRQPYFDAPDFPSNMPAIWDAHFGWMAGKYPLGIGEFGGRYEGDDRVWQDAFVDYLRAKGIRIWFYWALNPNSGDTGGVLLDDWKTVHEEKMALLRRLMEDQ